MESDVEVSVGELCAVNKFDHTELSGEDETFALHFVASKVTLGCVADDKLGHNIVLGNHHLLVKCCQLCITDEVSEYTQGQHLALTDVSVDGNLDGSSIFSRQEVDAVSVKLNALSTTTVNNGLVGVSAHTILVSGRMAARRASGSVRSKRSMRNPSGRAQPR